MGEKKDEKKGDQIRKKGDGRKKDDGPMPVVFNVYQNCIVTQIYGLESVKGDSTDNKLTVVGKVDPEKPRERIETKKEKEGGEKKGGKEKEKKGVEDKERKGGEKKGGKEKEKKGGYDKERKGGEKKGGKEMEKKPKEPAVTTALLKINCLCYGCIDKIRTYTYEIKGVQDVKFEKQKDLVIVKGTMDVKALPDFLKDKLKKNVEIVPPKPALK